MINMFYKYKCYENNIMCKASSLLYTPIAFNKRVTFWLQPARSLPCACVFTDLYARAIA